MDQTGNDIRPEDRTLAAITHLSGLSGYIIPLGGVIVPIVIWIVKSESATISSIAKQAILLNIVAFVSICLGILFVISVLLLPVGILLLGVVGLIAIILPIVGAVKAGSGTYYRYPLLGVQPPA